MSSTFDQDTYSRLLSEVAPRLIETEEEYNRILAITEELTFKKECTPEEQVLDKLLVALIEVYEAKQYPMESPAPHEILQHLLESSGTSQLDLVGVVGSTEVVSRIVDGSQPISDIQAAILGSRFKVPPILFL